MLVEQAQMWDLAMSPVSFTFLFSYYSTNHFLQLLAFRIVSAVVNVLELINIKVYSTSRPYVALAKSMGSTLAKNLNFLPDALAEYAGWQRRASYTNYIER